MFGGRVSRYPFPDHHAPPIALLAMATKEMISWLKRGTDYVVVVHCKAGKGRSGTLACSLLLAMDEELSPPKLQRNYNASEWADNRANSIMQDVTDTDDPSVASIDESDIPPSKSTTPKRQSQPEAHENPLHPPVQAHDTLDAKRKVTVDQVLQLHTSRRMKRGGKSQGVSIPSQRRWLRYWSEVLHHAAPPQLQLYRNITEHPPKARLYGINVRMKESGPGPTIAVMRVANLLLDKASRRDPNQDDRGASDVWVSLARYEDDMVQELERRVRENADIQYEDDGVTLKNSMFSTSKWDGKKMIASFARLGVAHGDQPKVNNGPDGSAVTYSLVPIPSSEWIDVGGETDDSAVEMNDGIVLDSAREVRVKIYMGQVRGISPFSC